jgi:hypothetical protein
MGRLVMVMRPDLADWVVNASVSSVCYFTQHVTSSLQRNVSSAFTEMSDISGRNFQFPSSQIHSFHFLFGGFRQMFWRRQVNVDVPCNYGNRRVWPEPQVGVVTKLQGTSHPAVQWHSGFNRKMNKWTNMRIDPWT